MHKLIASLETLNKTLNALQEKNLPNQYTPLLEKINLLKAYSIRGEKFTSFGDVSIYQNKALALSNTDRNNEISADIVLLLQAFLLLAESAKNENLLQEISHINLSSELASTELVEKIREKIPDNTEYDLTQEELVAIISENSKKRSNPNLNLAIEEQEKFTDNSLSTCLPGWMNTCLGFFCLRSRNHTSKEEAKESLPLVKKI